MSLVSFGVLAALTLLLFAPALSPDSVFYFRDVSQNHHPYRQLTVSMISAGEAPLWNPLRGAGQPLLANPNTLLLHPTTLLFLALPFEWAFKLSIIIQIFLAAAGGWLLQRDLGLSRSGSLLGAAVLAFSGYMVSLGNLLNLLDSAAFMPLTLWLTARAATRGFAPWGSLAALSLAVQVMAGEPAMLICTVAAFVGLGFSLAGRGAQSGESPSRSLRTRMGSVAGIALLALAISMVAVLPTTELLARSERGVGFDRDEALKWSLPPVALLEAAVPHLFGDPTRADVAKHWGGGVFDSGLPFVLSIYLGPGALILAALGLAGGLASRGARGKETIALGSLAILGTALSLGRFLPVYPALLSALPPLESVRYPVKYFLIVTWAVSLLAARGYDTISAQPDVARRWGRYLKWLLLWVLLFALVGNRLGAFRWFASNLLGLPASQAASATLETIQREIHRAFVQGAFMGLMMWILIVSGSGRLSRLGIFVVTVGLPLFTVAPLNPVASASFYSEPPSVGRLLDQADGAGRVWATPRPGGFAFRTPAGIEGDSLQAGFRWDRMTLRNATYFPQGYRFAYDRGNERLDVMPGAAVARALAGTGRAPMRPDAMSRLLSLAGVDRLITYGGIDLPGLTEAARLEGESNISVVVVRNATALPRASFAERAEVIPDLGMALRRLDDPSFDPNRVVILEQPGGAPSAGEGAAEAKIVNDTPNRVVVRTSSSAAGYLVLADTFYPGWKARVDGGEIPIIRANAMFRAVAVPAGAHEIEFVYAPSSVRSGLMVTAASLLLAALLAVPRRR